MKRLFKFLVIILVSISLTGCVRSDQFENIDIHVTSYVIEFIVNELYGDHSRVSSIYPDGINIHEYTLTPRQITEFSRGRLFLFNGTNHEREFAVSLINANNNLDIIDVAKGLDVRGDDARLWISPAHTLMVAQNIRNGLRELITNTSLLEAIDRNYEDLRLLLSTFDADFNLISQNANKRTIVAANRAFDFLTRYGFEVININDDEASSTAVTRAQNIFRAGENSALFILTGTEINDDIQSLIDAGAELSWVNPMFNLTDEERRNGDNYITFMNQFLGALRSEVF